MDEKEELALHKGRSDGFNTALEDAAKVLDADIQKANDKYAKAVEAANANAVSDLAAIEDKVRLAREPKKDKKK